MKRIFIFIVILFLAFSTVNAKDIFVDTYRGSSANSGLSYWLPLDKFENALDIAVVGDVIILIDYYELTAIGDLPYDIGGISVIGIGDVVFELMGLDNTPTCVFRINIGSAYARNMVIQNIRVQNSDLTPTFLKPVFTYTGTFSTSYPYMIEVKWCQFWNCGSVTASTDKCFNFVAAGPKWFFNFNYCYDSFTQVVSSSANLTLYGRNQFYNNVYEGSSTMRYAGISTDTSPNGGEVQDCAFITMTQGIGTHSSIVADSITRYEAYNSFYNVTTKILAHGTSQTINATSKTGIDPKIVNGQTLNTSPVFDPDSLTSWAGSGMYAKNRFITQSKTGVTVQ